MQKTRKCFLGLAGAAVIVVLVGLATHHAAWWQGGAVAACAALAIGLGGVSRLKGYQFTAWIITAVVAAMIYPNRFLQLGPVELGPVHLEGLDLRNPWLILIVVQLVMFGMGTQMSLRDFAGVMKMPWGVLVGVLCQFTIMPLVGFALTKAFHFPDEVAAGVILIGCCSSGLASNVMSYLAGANLPLSIALTAVATLLAPLMTPLWMKVLAGTLVEVSFFKMMLDIVKIVIVPIGAALLHDYLKFASPTGRRMVHAIAVVGILWLVLLWTGGWTTFQTNLPSELLPWIAMLGFSLAACVAGVLYHTLARWMPALDRWMPLASMFGIVYFTAVTTAAGRDDLLKVGGLLFLAAAIHNGLGYFFGYWLSRALGMDRASARTVAFEVGLQNGGMASGLAGAMGKLGTVGLAAAVFSPWMNVSGSILANYWRKRPTSSVAPSPDEPQPQQRESN
jgi:BASS family bile acid:Na+ symporter